MWWILNIFKMVHTFISYHFHKSIYGIKLILYWNLISYKLYMNENYFVYYLYKLKSTEDTISRNNDNAVSGQRLCTDHLFRRDAAGKEYYNEHRHLFPVCNFLPRCHSSKSHLHHYLLRLSNQLNRSFSRILILLQLYSHTNYTLL